MTLDQTKPPSPRGGWSQSVVEVPNALVVPPAKAKGLILETGVFDSRGMHIPMAATWRRDTLISKPPESLPSPQSKLNGKWLWGGILFHHFGHFQVESISRLWALRRFREDIDGVLFVSRDGSSAFKSFEKDYLNLFVGDLRANILVAPALIEELVVPGQAFGLGSIASGTRVFRRFIASDFAQDIAPKGEDHLFISRSRQPIDKGGFVGEAVLDARMEAAGYDVFWPEEHALEAQIARYKAAKRIVALDGSALHLFAMVGRKDQKAAIILRREPIASRSLRRHITSFTGSAPTVINGLNQNDTEKIGKKRLITALDFEHIGRVLKRRGFLRKSCDWGPLTEAELEQIVS